MRDLGSVVAISQVYQSPAAGPSGQPDFVNAAAALETELSPGALRQRLREIEADLGRIRRPDRFAPRPIDLDIALYDDSVGQVGDLTLPDPDLLVRPYLAVTVAELDRTARHPVTGERFSEIAERLRGSGELTARPDIVTEPGAATRSPQG